MLFLQKQIAEIYTKFKLYGKDPICWVRRNEPELKARHGTRDPKVLSKDVIGRWNDGINLVVTDDVILDFDVNPQIISMYEVRINLSEF